MVIYRPQLVSLRLLPNPNLVGPTRNKSVLLLVIGKRSDTLLVVGQRFYGFSLADVPQSDHFIV